jgi:hypothetical protein
MSGGLISVSPFGVSIVRLARAADCEASAMRTRASGETGDAFEPPGFFLAEGLGPADWAGSSSEGVFGGRDWLAADFGGKGLGSDAFPGFVAGSDVIGSCAEGRIESEIFLVGFFLPEGDLAIEKQ